MSEESFTSSEKTASPNSLATDKEGADNSKMTPSMEIPQSEETPTETKPLGMHSATSATPAIQRLHKSRLEFKINSPSDALGSPDVNQMMRSKLKHRPAVIASRK